jgi:hypothetical protein
MALVRSQPCPDLAYGFAAMPFEKFTRASDIADFVYCKRAWHLKQRHGARSALSAELARGTQFHERHSEAVHAAPRRVPVAGWVALAALLLFLVWLLLALR